MMKKYKVTYTDKSGKKRTVKLTINEAGPFIEKNAMEGKPIDYEL